MVGYKQQPDMVGVVFAVAGVGLAGLLGVAFFRWLVVHFDQLWATFTQN